MNPRVRWWPPRPEEITHDIPRVMQESIRRCLLAPWDGTQSRDIPANPLGRYRDAVLSDLRSVGWNVHACWTEAGETDEEPYPVLRVFNPKSRT